MTPMIFLHLTDAEDDTPVRIRMDLVESMYVHQDNTKVRSFHGQAVVTHVDETYTMVCYTGHMHGVRESIGDIESQMADAYELAGIAAL